MPDFLGVLRIAATELRTVAPAAERLSLGVESVGAMPCIARVVLLMRKGLQARFARSSSTHCSQC